MAIQISPGVNVSEFDQTTTVPAVSTTIGAMAGIFKWGPVGIKSFVTSENDVVNVFGKPTDYNYETFFTAANFLSYGNQLWVVRVTDGAFNAVAPVLGANATPLATANIEVMNVDDYNSNYAAASGSPYNSIAFVAKYPGTTGNSLKISVCDSPSAYQQVISNNSVNDQVSGANIASVTFTSNTGSANVTVTVTTIVGLANASVSQANAVAAYLANSVLQVGNFLEVGNSSLGYQNLQITGITPSGTTGGTSGAGFNSTLTVTLATPVLLGANVVQSSAKTSWEYYNQVPGAPATSDYLMTRGFTADDQLHVVVADATGEITGTVGAVVEVFPFLSRATDAKTSQGATSYYKNVLNNTSKYIWAGTVDYGSASSANAATVASSSSLQSYKAAMIGASDGNGEANCSLAALQGGYVLYQSKENIDISPLLCGKARGASAETSSPSSPGVNYAVMSDYLISEIANYRKDCVAFISPALPDAVPQQAGGSALNNILAFYNNLTTASSYAVMDSGYKYQYDRYNDLYRYVPLNGDIAGLCAYTDQVRDPWYSPAGFNRGQIKNVVKLPFNPNKAQRDLLYNSYINPVVTLPGQGTVLLGDKTLQGFPSAFDRINVRRLFITVEKAIAKAAQSSLFEINNAYTRAQFVNYVSPYLRDIQGRNGIYNFIVVCDATNNTPQVIDSNQFVGDIYIQPAKSINFIQLNFVAVRTGVDFSTIIGNF